MIQQEGALDAKGWGRLSGTVDRGTGDVSGVPWSLHVGEDSAGDWGLPPTRWGRGGVEQKHLPKGQLTDQLSCQ